MTDTDGIPDTILHEEDVREVIRDEMSKETAQKGLATLVAGTKTVADTSVTADTMFRLASKTLHGTPGALYISAKVVGTSFTVTSTSNTDTSVVAYEVIEY